jgi:outer membrane protein OmpA-like peptidoglycan-associated protein
MGKLIIAFILVFAVSGIAWADGPNYGITGSVWGDIYFDKGSAELSNNARKHVADIYEWTKKHPKASVLLAGYDDQRTPEKASIELGWKRTQAVKDLLVQLGADADRVNMISFGNTRVTAAGTNEEDLAKNRRVRYRVVEPSDSERIEGKPSGVCQRCKKQ